MRIEDFRSYLIKHNDKVELMKLDVEEAYEAKELIENQLYDAEDRANKNQDAIDKMNEDYIEMSGKLEEAENENKELKTQLETLHEELD